MYLTLYKVIIYTSYAYNRGGFGHGLRSLYLIRRNYKLIQPRVNEPWELHQIFSKKLGYNKYLINGNNWRSASDNFDRSNVIMQRSGCHMYIHYAKGNRFERNYTNGTYYRSGFNRNFKELQDTF